MSRLHQPLSSAISFQFLAEVAVGSTARIDLCRAVGGERNGQLLAVKRLLPHIAEDPGYASMFLDEVWMTASLKHPNVVEVAGWGTDAQGAYLAVELVQGVSLARLMKTVFDTGEIFSERMVVFIGSKICSGLAAAHALRSPDGEMLNLVHRDLTPANVLLGFNGDVKIADFGLAKAKQRLTKTLTGLLKGQPQYMSPEQAKGGQEIDGRSDLFSLGVVLFELFAGRRPWSATSELEMVHVAANEPPVDLREYRPKIDKELVSVVMRCLEKDPDARFQSAFEVEARLDTWLRAHGYVEGTEEALARFVRRNAMRQMRWFERAVSGELAPMPDSMRPGPPKAVPPRVPSYSNVTNAPHGREQPPSATAAPRARVRPRKPVDSEVTDVTDVESRVAALHAQSAERAPVILDKDGRAPVAGAEIDWGEEIPTLVQKPGQASVLAERARVRPRPMRAEVRPIEPLDEPSIVDDDSNRTTAVKKPSRPLPATLAGGRADVGALPRRNVESLVDLESEEVPTVPLKHALHRPPAPVDPLGPPRGRPTSQPPRPMIPPAVPVPAPPIHPAPDHRLRDVSTPSGVRVTAMGPVSAPMSRELVMSEEFLVSEADRLAAEAVRLGEEAKAAAALAVRKTSLAKIAGDAATIAAEAVRMAATAGVQHGARRLEEALALEESLRRGDASPHAVPTAAMGRNGTHTMPGAAAEMRGLDLPDLSRPSSSPSQPMLAHPNPPMGFDHAGVLRPMPDPNQSALDQFKSTFDPQMFRAQLKPEIWGMPRPVAIALFVVTFVVFIIFLWVVT